MIHLIRWLIRKLKGRTTSPADAPADASADAPAAASGRDEPAVQPRGDRFVRPPRPAAPGGTGGAPALSVDHLTKRFGDRVAFEDVSFEIGHGEVFGFLGPNGAGKTTTVRTLGTLIAPTSGSATVAGIPLTPENGVEIRRRISIMPESPGLYLRLSVAENLECFADLYEVPDPSDRIDRALRAVNLADRASDACGTLSKGLRQRVALARALLSDPEVLFLDEPTSGLDPVAARDVHELIDELRQRGVTIFLTTHRLEEAERLCDRVAILNTTLRTIGRPDELRDQLFAKTLTVRTARPAPRAGPRLRRPPGRRRLAPGRRRPRYVLAVSDPAVAAPAVTRALVAAGADVLSIGESRHSLEDVYLELIDEDDGGAPAMSVSRRRVRAIFRKELREYRRNRSIVAAMAILPLIFLIQPLVAVFALRRVGIGGARSTSMCCCTCSAIPALVPGDARRLLGGRRAPAGHARAGAHDADPPRGVPAGQGAGGPRPVGGGLVRGLRASSSPASSSSPIRAWRRRSSEARTCSPSWSSRRCSPAGRSGSASRSRPGPATSASPSSSARSRASRRSR